MRTAPGLELDLGLAHELGSELALVPVLVPELVGELVVRRPEAGELPVTLVLANEQVVALVAARASEKLARLALAWELDVVGTAVVRPAAMRQCTDQTAVSVQPAA